MAITPHQLKLLADWRSVGTDKSRDDWDFSERDRLLDELIREKVFPGEDQTEYERTGGLYPDLEDPEFIMKLIRKQEFQESKQKSVKESMEEGIDKCRTAEDFEITPVQRFVSRFLSPRTPYNSALLFHGVGVGKTCAAVTVAESYLHEYPARKVYVVAPPNIQEGFRRTIFDMKALKVVKGETNKHSGCTGDTYLDITGTYTEYNKATIESRVGKAVRSRYEFFGYTSFYNHILGLMSGVPTKGRTREQVVDAQNAVLREEFSNRVIIVDEAHNLRDNPLEGEEESADDANPSDSADAKAGKKLTPFFKRVLEVSDGISLLLMTATPMYNSFIEIIFLLNLLLINDKYPGMLRVDDVFNVKEKKFVEGGEKVLGRIAGHYISFMRGENPLTFPLRLVPQSPLLITEWPFKNPKGVDIHGDERLRSIKLPCVAAYYDEAAELMYKEKSLEIVSSAEGMGITNMDILVQAGNWIFPGSEGDDFMDRIRQVGFDRTFVKEKRGGLVYFRNEDEARGASWLLYDNLSAYSAKCRVLLERLNNSRGVCFVYSRFVPSGALSIALALEANGYTCWNRDIGFLGEGNQHPQGRQCALCPRHEQGHGQVPEEAGTAAHTFKPAKYVLLTGSEDLSPTNAKSIDAARAPTNKYGQDVKVILGSQVAGEGLDLKYVREVFVFDSWYHLNKLEQVVGRGIRNCSHASLEPAKRNCTVTLLVNAYNTDPATESIDMYSYRMALRKALIVGQVTRVIKEYAIDCSLNKDAIVVSNLDPIPVLYDSQGVERRDVPINDVPFTPLCDWVETCDYDCKYVRGRGGLSVAINTDIPIEMQDSSTYDEYTARFQMNRLKNYLIDRITKGTPFVTFEKISNDFAIIPAPLLRSLLTDIIQQRIRIVTKYGTGSIILRNGYYIFQPSSLKDTSIPIALRTMVVPVPRDRFEPKAEELVQHVSGDGTGDGAGSEALWPSVLAWTGKIRNGEEGAGAVPEAIVVAVNALKQSLGKTKAQGERLEMLSWLYNNVKGDAEVRGVYADIVAEFFWDEFVPTAVKVALFKSGHEDETLQAVAKESFWIMEDVTYIRILDSTTNDIVYLYVNAGAAADTVDPCPRAVIEVLEKDTVRDPLLKKKINVITTGYEYGFIIFHPKKKQLVYKKNTPPVPGAKITRGSECSINSNTSYEMKRLRTFGKKLQEAGKHTLGMDVIHEDSARNSVRVCTVSDMVMRYLDKIQFNAKRWFYRPLEAKLHGHPLR